MSIIKKIIEDGEKMREKTLYKNFYWKHKAPKCININK